jgi:hypothetical protein
MPASGDAARASWRPSGTPARKIVVVLAVWLAVLAAVAAGASASIDQFGGRDLPGHAWGGGHVYGPGLFETVGEAETSSSVCTGPVVKSGGGYVAPYGWACHPVQVSWVFPQLTGLGAVYNPNPGTFPKWGGLAFFH